MNRPDFFIVGAPKCGTTTLYNCLRQHPEIFMPSRKEPRFFCDDLDSGSERDGFFFLRDEASYLSLFSCAGKAKRIGEASTTYLYSEVSARRIREFCGSASIIIMLRNPVDMLYSYHSERYYNGNEDIPDFEAALAVEGERRRGLRLPRNAANLKGLYYKDVAKFSIQIQRYLEVFGQDRVRIVLLDDLKRDPLSLYKDIFTFLGVSQSFTPEFQIVNPNKQVRSKMLKSFLQNRSTRLRGVARRLIPAGGRHKLAQYMARMNRKYVSRRPMDPQTRKWLNHEFAQEVQILSEMLSRDLSHWQTTG